MEQSNKMKHQPPEKIPPHEELGIVPEKFYAAIEVTALLPGDFHYTTIINWLQTGKLVGRKIGHSWRIRGYDIIRFYEGGNFPEQNA
jgi:hypothetical protein